MPSTETKEESKDINKLSKADSIALANNLRDVDFITTKQHLYLHECVQKSEKEFCLGLHQVYKEKVLTYLKNTQGQLAWNLKHSSPLSANVLDKVAQSLSIRYAYIALACDDKGDPLLLLTHYIAPDLAISFGFKSVIHKLLEIEGELDLNRFNPLFEANKNIFVDQIAYWKMIKDLGMEKVKQLNLTADRMLFSISLLESATIEDFIYARMKSSAELLKSGWKSYLETVTSSITPHHAIAVSMFNYIDNDEIINKVINKTIAAFTKEFVSTEGRQRIIDHENAIYTELHNSVGTICGPALNTLKGVPGSKTPSYDEITRDVNNELLQQRQAIMSASGIESREEEIKQYQAEIKQQESHVASHISNCRGRLDQAMRDAKNRIRKDCSPGFFVGVGLKGPFDTRGNLNFEFSHVNIKTKIH